MVVVAMRIPRLTCRSWIFDEFLTTQGKNTKKLRQLQKLTATNSKALDHHIPVR
jgi:hypothetical protein